MICRCSGGCLSTVRVGGRSRPPRLRWSASAACWSSGRFRTKLKARPAPAQSGLRILTRRRSEEQQANFTHRLHFPRESCDIRADGENASRRAQGWGTNARDHARPRAVTADGSHDVAANVEEKDNRPASRRAVGGSVLVVRIDPRDYWSSLRTFCDDALAVASTEVPACCRICARVIAAVSAAKSVSRIFDSLEVMFSSPI